MMKDKPFIFRDTQVKAYKYGDTVEMTTSHGKHNNPIRKLNSDEFLDLRTGEIRLYNKQALNRSDNIKAVKRTFVKLRRLIGNNFFGGSTELWVTLTYKENMTNPTTAYEDFRAFMKSLKRKYPNILYISVIEPQGRGSWHYHVLLKNDTPIFIKNESITAYWTKENFQSVLSNICIDDFYEHMSFVMLWVYYMTGIRVSEGLALTWSDIDFKKKKMRIHHTLEMKNQSNFQRKPYTKTASGMRIISLDDDTVTILKRWQQIQKEHSVHTFIFSYTDLPLYRSTVQRIIQRYAKISNVPIVQGKGLRHSHVSYLINEFNADILVVSKRLGHSSPEITLKHYAHLWGRNDESIAEQMTGNIKFNYSTESKMKFNGNQAVKL